MDLIQGISERGDDDSGRGKQKRTAVWLTPGVIRRMDSWLEEDNCKTRSEFIEKALRFYMGYLATEDTSEYLSPRPGGHPAGYIGRQ